MNWGCRWGGGEERKNQTLKVQLKDTFKICIFVQGYMSTLPYTNSVLGYKSTHSHTNSVQEYKSHPYTNSVLGYKSHPYTQARLMPFQIHPQKKKSSIIYNIHELCSYSQFLFISVYITIHNYWQEARKE